jgi:hypothetical protein
MDDAGMHLRLRGALDETAPWCDFSLQAAEKNAMIQGRQSRPFLFCKIFQIFACAGNCPTFPRGCPAAGTAGEPPK